MKLKEKKSQKEACHRSYSEQEAIGRWERRRQKESPVKKGKSRGKLQEKTA